MTSDLPDVMPEVVDEPFSLWRFCFGESIKMQLVWWYYRRMKREREALKFRNQVLETRLQDMADAHVALKAMVASIGQQHLSLAVQNGYQVEKPRS